MRVDGETLRASLGLQVRPEGIPEPQSPFEYLISDAGIKALQKWAGDEPYTEAFFLRLFQKLTDLEEFRILDLFDLLGAHIAFERRVSSS
jgi:hypothetical protein